MSSIPGPGIVPKHIDLNPQQLMRLRTVFPNVPRSGPRRNGPRSANGDSVQGAFNAVGPCQNPSQSLNQSPKCAEVPVL